jgi:hypothetical protein
MPRRAPVIARALACAEAIKHVAYLAGGVTPLVYLCLLNRRLRSWRGTQWFWGIQARLKIVVPRSRSLKTQPPWWRCRCKGNRHPTACLERGIKMYSLGLCQNDSATLRVAGKLRAKSDRSES